MFKQNGQGKAGHDHPGTKPFRCLCGSMLARLVPGGVEPKMPALQAASHRTA